MKALIVLAFIAAGIQLAVKYRHSDYWEEEWYNDEPTRGRQPFIPY